MLKAQGIIKFDPPILTRKHARQAEWKRHANIDLGCDMAAYYSWFIRKRYSVILNPPQRGTHVTFIADMVPDMNLYNSVKAKWDKKPMSFEFDTNVRTNGEDWWLRVYSEDLLDIREEAGLSRNPYFNLHLTLGYAAPRLDKNGNEMGGSNLEHSRYIYEYIKRFEHDAPRKV